MEVDDSVFNLGYGSRLVDCLFAEVDMKLIVIQQSHFDMSLVVELVLVGVVPVEDGQPLHSLVQSINIGIGEVVIRVNFFHVELLR